MPRNQNTRKVHTLVEPQEMKTRPVQIEKLIIDKVDRGNGITVYIARNKVKGTPGPFKVIVKGDLSVDPLLFFKAAPLPPFGQ